MSLLLLLFVGATWSWGHKPANELDPSVYKDYQIKSARHWFRDEQVGGVTRKRAAPGNDLEIDYSGRPITRQWNEILLSAIRVN
jgi:hypothetical protein